MAVTIDPVTGKKTITYNDSLTVREGVEGRVFVNPSKSWNAVSAGQALIQRSRGLSTIMTQEENAGLLESTAGQNLRSVNSEFSSYYKAYMDEEQKRRTVAKAFGVQNTVLSGSGTTTGADAMRKGTVLGGNI